MSISKNEMLGGAFCLMEACKFTIKIFPFDDANQISRSLKMGV
jgi:hypothetical protein